jgi:predicted DNA-binding transcriptional regulator AlpA
MATERLAPEKLSRRIEPRGLHRQQAASYVGISPTKFDGLVTEGRMPRPRRIDGRVVWDRFELDLYFDALPVDGESLGGNAWDRMLGVTHEG